MPVKARRTRRVNVNVNVNVNFNVLKDGTSDALWLTLLNPLSHHLALRDCLGLRLVCIGLRDAGRVQIGGALKALFPARERMLAAALLTGVGQVLSDLTMFMYTVGVAQGLQFAFEVSQHAIVARCGEGTRRLVAGSFALHKLLQAEDIMADERWPKWSPGDLDVFVEGAEECVEFRSKDVKECAALAGLSEEVYDHRHDMGNDKPMNGPYGVAMLDITGSDAARMSLKLALDAKTAFVSMRSVGGVVRAALKAEYEMQREAMPRWRMDDSIRRLDTFDVDGVHVKGIDALSRTWVSRDDRAVSWHNLHEEFEAAHRDRYRRDRRLRGMANVKWAINAAALEVKSELQAALVRECKRANEAAQELDHKAQRPHFVVNCIPYESVCHTEEQLTEPPPPIESIVEGFDLLLCQVYVRATPNGYTFGGPGAAFVREEARRGGAVRATLAPGWLARHVPALGDSPPNPDDYFEDPSDDSDDDEADELYPTQTVECIVGQILDRLKKYTDRGFALDARTAN
jgi:hypothetical protein